MTDARVKILEDQLDEMAGRMARLGEELRVLRRALARPSVLEILHLEKSDLESLAAASVAATERSRTILARMEALAAARKDQLLNRLDRAERIADLTGKSFSDAWSSTSK